jgi:sporulation protein YlmC with PRC-barrel domain
MKMKPTFFKSPRLAFVLAMLLVGVLVLAACDTGAGTGAADTEPDVAAETPTSVAETPTSAVTDTETMTETEDMGDTGAMTETEDMGDTGAMTETDDMGDTGTMTDTETITDTETTTDTQGVGDTDSTASTTASMDDTMDMTGIGGAEDMLIRASTLDDYDFVNRDGGVSGTVEDFLVDVSTGNILLAFVEYGGMLELGDTNLVMPLSAFQLGDGQLILNFDEQVLENYPDVGDDWPDVTNPLWDDDVSAFWRNIDLDPGFDFNEANPGNVMWLSEMTGYALADLGEGNGTIQDVLIDLGASRVKYVLFNFGTAVDDDPYIIPYSALDVQNVGENELMFNSTVDLAALQSAPRFDRNLYPDTEILPRDFAPEINDYWIERGFDVS